MWKIIISFVIGFGLVTQAAASDCSTILSSMKLPKKTKTRGKQKIAKWEDTDKILNTVASKVQGTSCEFTFGQLFKIGKKDDAPFFPLTNSIVRVVPEESLMDLDIHTQEDGILGTYAGKILYEKSGNLYAKKTYKVYYFQYKTPSGKFQSVGSELLLDRFLLKWLEIENRTAISAREEN